MSDDRSETAPQPVTAIELTMVSFGRGVEMDEAASEASGFTIRRLTAEHVVTLSGRQPGDEVVTVVGKADGDGADERAAGAALKALVSGVLA